LNERFVGTSVISFDCKWLLKTWCIELFDRFNSTIGVECILPIKRFFERLSIFALTKNAYRLVKNSRLSSKTLKLLSRVLSGVTTPVCKSRPFTSVVSEAHRLLSEK